MQRGVQASLQGVRKDEPENESTVEEGSEDVAAVIAELEDEMTEAAGRLEFERAALLRDQVEALRSGDYKKIAKHAAKPIKARKPKR